MDDLPGNEASSFIQGSEGGTRMRKSSLVTLFVSIMAIAVLSAPAFAGAVITNGSGIYLGVLDLGNLGYTDGITTSLNGANKGSGNTIGVSVYADLSAYGRGVGLFDATAPGCICEGWGAAVNGTIGGGANVDSGTSGVTLVSFSFTPSTATSTVSLDGSPLQVINAYAPSASTALMQDTVTMTNTSSTDSLTDVTYRRVMDWDVPPSEFNEFVTIQGWPATDLVRTTDNGFQSPNPLIPDSGIECPVNANFSYCGPDDHGALFDFDFGTLAPGESKTFNIYYGAAFNTGDALAALGTVGAEVYSFGNWGGDTAQTGQPITYIFGFEGVGGTPVPTVPEPSTYVLLLTGLGMIAYRKFRA